MLDIFKSLDLDFRLFLQILFINLLIFLFIYFYIFIFDLLDLAKNGSCSRFVPNVQSCRTFNQLLLLLFKAYLSINHKLNFTFSFICALLYTMKKQTNINTEFQQMLEITKSNYKEYFKHWNYREFRKYKKRLKLDLENNPLTLSKYYDPVKSSIYNEINMPIQGGKSNKYWNNKS